MATPSSDWDAKNPDPAISSAPYRLYNIGNNQPVELMKFVSIIEECLGKKATINFLPQQQGDVVATWANVSELMQDMNFRPATSIETGISRFIEWYRVYYGDEYGT